MKTERRGANSVPMSNETRGHAIKARRLAHGFKSVRALAMASGVSREAVTAAEAGEASEGTYERLEAWLDRFDEETGEDEPERAEGGEQLVTFQLKGNFGVDVVVSGPVSDIDKLQAAVERLIQSMGKQGK